MARNEKEWHPNFEKYVEEIVNHPNYKGLPIKRKDDGSYAWVAPKKSEIGKARIEWCKKKAMELGLIDDGKEYPGMYADVMLEIHPTKKRVCQICGKSMSLYYHYPTKPFVNSLNKKFHTDFTICDHISDIWDTLNKNGVSEKEIASFLITKGNLNVEVGTVTKKQIIDLLEYRCRKGGKKCLGPGAMSNFPDRFDGFHSYNRCCRQKEDKGRSKQNLKSYGKDRRAYEYWSDGNIHAANQFMGSSFFDGISADHIGPISLGFVHDPRYLQPMPTSNNASKRDRLQIEDVEKIIRIQKETNVYPMSWQSKLIWDFISKNYSSNIKKVSTTYRDILKQNMSNYMFILQFIIDTCPKNGKEFLIDAFLRQNFDYFNYSYSFNEKGQIIERKPRHFTDRNKNEINRYCRKAIEAVNDYNDKENRNIKNDLIPAEIKQLKYICKTVEDGMDYSNCRELVVKLVEDIEKRLIMKL